MVFPTFFNFQGMDLDYCDIEWFALETNRDHSVIFEIFKDGEALYSQQQQQQKKPGADCSTGHKLFYWQIQT